MNDTLQDWGSARTHTDHQSTLAELGAQPSSVHYDPHQANHLDSVSDQLSTESVGLLHRSIIYSDCHYSSAVIALHNGALTCSSRCINRSVRKKRLFCPRESFMLHWLGIPGIRCSYYSRITRSSAPWFTNSASIGTIFHTRLRTELRAENSANTKNSRPREPAQHM